MPRSENNMQYFHGSGNSLPMTKISTEETSDQAAAVQQAGHGRLATEDLLRLVAAMVD